MPSLALNVIEEGFFRTKQYPTCHYMFSVLVEFLCIHLLGLFRFIFSRNWLKLSRFSWHSQVVNNNICCCEPITHVFQGSGHVFAIPYDHRTSECHTSTSRYKVTECHRNFQDDELFPLKAIQTRLAVPRQFCQSYNTGRIFPSRPWSSLTRNSQYRGVRSLRIL